MNKLLKLALLLSACLSWRLAVVVVRWRRMVRFVRSQLADKYPVIAESEGILGSLLFQQYRFTDMIRAGVRVKQVMDHSNPPTKTVITMGSLFNPEPTICTTDRAIWKHVAKDNFESWDRPDYVRGLFEGSFNGGVFMTSHNKHQGDRGKTWKSRRKFLSRLFTKNIFDTVVASQFDKSFGRLQALIDSGLEESTEAILPMKTKLAQLALELSFSVSSGGDLHDLPPKLYEEFFLAVDNMGGLALRRVAKPFWRHLGWFYASERQIKKYMRTLEEVYEGVITERRNDKNLHKRGDLLSMFLQADPSTPAKVMAPRLAGVTSGGLHTTAATMSFACYLLAIHPHIQEDLYEEVKGVLNKEGSSDETISVEILKKMPLLNGVFFETSRLYPAAPRNMKAAMVDDVLPDGTFVRKGTEVSIETVAMFRDPTKYEKPNEFIPSRWVDSENAIGTFDDLDFTIFGTSPRICLGKDIAIFEIKSLIARLVLRYKFTYWSEAPLLGINDPAPYHSRMALDFKGDLDLCFVRRNAV